MSPDVAASIKAHLLQRAKNAEEEFQLYLVRYACERFLYRLGASEPGKRCVLKGAGLLSLWLPDPYRTTRDLDFLASGASNEASVAELIHVACSVACPEDGLVFDLDSLVVAPIRAQEDHQGHRVRLTALLGKARIHFQLDFGFGGAVVPAPVEIEYPTLLPTLPPPRIRAYRREVSLAEKFEAMVTLGLRNSRMKDFHDVWALSSAFSFESAVLSEAVAACFERRGTAWTEEPPHVLSAAFYESDDLRERWAAYLASGAFQNAPPAAFTAIGERVREFLGPVRDSIAAGEAFSRHWAAGGPWQ